jgi:hypothetical protein
MWRKTMMKKICLTIIFSILSCSSNPSNSISAWKNFSINDSISVSFPDYYSQEDGRFTGRDTWGFYKSRNDDKVVFSFETGPGTPYSPLTVNSLSDTHYVYPYGINSPKKIVKKFYNMELLRTNSNINLAFYSKLYSKYEKNGIVLMEDEISKNYSEILFITFPDSDRKEVESILKTISRQ